MYIYIKYKLYVSYVENKIFDFDLMYNVYIYVCVYIYIWYVWVFVCAANLYLIT